eukprot:m.114469 g.114469  ORF g.114469 m.114469 type:complete len:112 (-) comp13053_c0_seq2:63-398(-)
MSERIPPLVAAGPSSIGGVVGSLPWSPSSPKDARRESTLEGRAGLRSSSSVSESAASFQRERSPARRALGVPGIQPETSDGVAGTTKKFHSLVSKSIHTSPGPVSRHRGIL